MKKILSLVFIPILACSLFILSGCVKDAASTPVTTTPIPSSTPQPEDKHLDWLLYATKYSADGQVLEEFQFTVTGTVPGKQDLSVFLQPVTLDIVWPDSFRFSGNGEETYSGLASSDHETDYFYFCRLWCPYPAQQTSVYCRFGIAPALGYMMFIWDDEAAYLVASTDPDTPADVITEFFSSALRIDSLGK